MMTRPSIIRADTIDLQDQSAPSAKDHSKHPDPDPVEQSHAHHQAETLREVAYGAAEEESFAPQVRNGNGGGARAGAGAGAGAGDDLHQFAEDLVAGVTGSAANGGAMQRQQTQAQAQGQSQQAQQAQQQQQQQDELAIAQNGGVSSSDEGDLDGDADDLDDDLMDRISSSPSIEDARIWSYYPRLRRRLWWWSRAVFIIFVLSATMLGDQAAKQKNAFRSIRRKRKTVTFTDPTYVDYSEIEYSTDEEDIEELFAQQAAEGQQQDGAQQQQKQTQQEAAQQIEDEIVIADDTATVEPLKTRSKKEVKVTEPAAEDVAAEEEDAVADGEYLEDGKPAGPRQTRNGTVRNTDSFYRDESVETKKITLTPNLLRDDGAPRPSTDSASKDLKPRPSLDKLDKELATDKESKKKTAKEKEKPQQKDKKPSAIRNFFSRKDKKRTSEDDDGESFGKRSMDMVESSRDSEDPMSAAEEQASPEKAANVQRSPSKLQKHQPRTEPSVASRGGAGQQQQQQQQPQQQQKASNNAELTYLESRNNDVSNVPPASMRIVDPETHEAQEVPSNAQPTPEQPQPQPPAQQSERSAISKLMSPLSASNSSSNSGEVVKPKKTVRAKTRMELDESDSDEVEQVLMEDAPAPGPQPQEESPPAPQRAAPTPDRALRPQLPGAFPDSFQSMSTMSSDKTVTPLQTQQQPQQAGADRRLESPMEVSPVSPPNGAYPPPLMGDTSSQDAVSPEASPEPELPPAEGMLPRDATGLKDQQLQQQTWDDTKLRAFFDDGEHVRDLLAVVYDKSDVVPAGMDHPVVGGLFREQNAKLAEITTNLDNMLGDWLARKQRLRGTV